jgi:uncharacterized protein
MARQAGDGSGLAMSDPTPSLGSPHLDRLAAFLEAPGLDDGVMTLPELDGFLAGLVAGPVDVPPEEWLPLLWGDAPPPFAGDEEAIAIIGAVMARHDEIKAEIADGSYDPMFWADKDGVPLPEDWVVGFMTAAGLREAAWLPLLQSEEDGYILFPIFAFCNDEAGKPFLDMSKRDRENLRLEAHEMISQAVLDVAEHWGNRPKTPPPVPVRTGPKIGRNDPCPCGSGKKHKKCCGA